MKSMRMSVDLFMISPFMVVALEKDSAGTLQNLPLSLRYTPARTFSSSSTDDIRTRRKRCPPERPDSKAHRLRDRPHRARPTRWHETALEHYGFSLFSS